MKWYIDDSVKDEEYLCFQQAAFGSCFFRMRIYSLELSTKFCTKSTSKYLFINVFAVGTTSTISPISFLSSTLNIVGIGLKALDPTSITGLYFFCFSFVTDGFDIGMGMNVVFFRNVGFKDLSE